MTYCIHSTFQMNEMRSFDTDLFRINRTKGATKTGIKKYNISIFLRSRGDGEHCSEIHEETFLNGNNKNLFATNLIYRVIIPCILTTYMVFRWK